MRKIITVLWCCFSALAASAQWQAAGLTSAPDGVYAIESHNGILFASTNTDGLVKSTDNGQTWQTAAQSGFTTNPISVRVSHLKSTGTKLYAVTFNAHYASSMIYVSSDDGQTFIPDTAGIPHTGNNELINIDRLYHHNGFLVADVANLGNWHKPVAGANWQRNDNVSTEYGELMGFYGTTFYIYSGYHLYLSGDNGQSWTQAADANLPPWFTASVLNVNPVNGRIYVAGTSVTTQEYRLMYSDDGGASWDSIPLGPYRVLNWLGQPQTLTAMYSYGTYLQIGFQNDAGTTQPDILRSINGGVSFEVDTAGLPAAAGQTNAAHSFVQHDGKLFMALSYIDAYYKPLSSLVSSGDYLTADRVLQVFPNPSADRFTFRSGKGIVQLEVFDLNGRKVAAFSPGITTSDFSFTLAEPSGIYIVRVTDSFRHVQSLRIMLTGQ